MDPNLPFVDIKACFALCQGGACIYVPKPDCLTDDFICTYAAPNISAKYNREIAVILGNALIWATFSSRADMVHEIVRNRIVEAYNLLPEKLPDDENPVTRKSVYVYGDVNNYRLADAAPVDDNDNNVPGEAGVGLGVGDNHDIVTLITTMHNEVVTKVDNLAVSTRDQLETLTTRVDRLQQTTTTNFNRINRQPHRMLHAAAVPALQPHQQENPPLDAAAVVNVALPRGQVDNNIGIGQHAIAINASLSPSPPTLHDLWLEWQFGIGGRKPARLFTSRESGVTRHKSTFSRRKAFWELMEHLIRSGYTYHDACARIYQVYGENQRVSYILNQIIFHRKHNTSPLMRY